MNVTPPLKMQGIKTKLIPFIRDNIVWQEEIMTKRSKEDQLEKNWKAYQKIKDKLEEEYFGHVALLHDEEPVAIYYDSRDAYAIGCEKFGLGHFYLATIEAKPVSLGWQGYLMFN